MSVARDKRRIALAILVMLFSIFALISLFDFKTGMIGSLLKTELLRLFGLSSYIFITILFCEGLNLLGLKLPILPLLLLLPTSSLFFHFLIPQRLFPYKGGALGKFLFEKLSYYIGTAGSSIVLVVSLVLVLYWLLGKPMKILLSLFQREEIEGDRSSKRRERREAERPQTRKASVEERPVKLNSNGKEPTVGEASSSEEKEEKAEITLPPPIDLLHEPPPFKGDGEPIEEEKRELEETFRNFGIDAKLVNVVMGPTVHRFEVQPARGVKVNRIASLSKEIALNLKAESVRIEAPIPGKGLVGIEVPNKVRRVVYLKEIITSQAFKKAKGSLAIALGKDVAGSPLIIDISELPHLLVAGSTGSGKSVCLNVIIMSLIFRNKPEDLRIVLIDPKRVEFSIYNDIPYLAVPVVTEVKDAVNVLNCLLEEMEKRYRSFSRYGVRDISGFNKLKEEKLPYVVVVIDELADLMMSSPKEVEESICRLAQMARATGIHLVLATQRPSVNVVTGLIKANIPARIAFSLPSQADSRTILDFSGAERLLGKGDMLFLSPAFGHPIRAQCAWVSEDEVREVSDYLRRLGEPEYWDELLKAPQEEGEELDDIPQDPLFRKAIEVIVNTNTASATLFQRKLGIGYARAARLLDILERMGIVGPSKGGGKPRDILKSEEELRELLE